MKKIIFSTIFFLMIISSFGYAATDFYNYNYTCNVTDDTYVYGATPNWNFGTENYTYHNYSSTDNKAARSYYKFYNCSNEVNSYYNSSTHYISDVELVIKLSSNRRSRYSMNLVVNETWEELDLTWNDQPCGTSITTLNGICGGDLDSQEVFIPMNYDWNVTSVFPTASNNTQNISFHLGNITNPAVNHGYNNFTTKQYETFYGGESAPNLVFYFTELPPEPPAPTPDSLCSTIDETLLTVFRTVYILAMLFAFFLVLYNDPSGKNLLIVGIGTTTMAILLEIVFYFTINVC